MKRVFIQDEDCHWYLIPPEMVEEFMNLTEDDEGWAKPEWKKFDDMRVRYPSSYTVENVQPINN